ncbi:casein kinase I isoform delta [Ophiocordyceps sinensis CO18]|nr:casein kinase I isoform delta [Ophiocordyceps sinensis CO18]
MKDILINERYRVDYKIGQGGFGLVYAGTDLQTNTGVALKLMPNADEPRVLQAEAEVYRALAGGAGIPRVLWCGDECDYCVLVHELLGPSLEDLFNYCGRRFSLKTVLLLADQAISRLEYIHRKGFLHRDIKPDNFLMGLGRQGNVLYTIDFGLATEHGSQEHWTSGPRFFGGTVRYASINNHNGREHTWSDDLESLGYVLLYFARGSLPWQGMKAANDHERSELIKNRKMSLSAEELCEGLPQEFTQYIEHARSLAFEERPKYAYLRRLFRRLFTAQGYQHDNVFDWTEKLFHEIHNSAVEPAPPVSPEEGRPEEGRPAKQVATGRVSKNRQNQKGRQQASKKEAK